MLHTLVLASLLRPATLDVTNVTPGETVRYPLLLLQGTTSEQAVLAGRDWKSVVRFPAAEGRFAAAVELKPGPNLVLVAAGRDTVKVQVNYVPMKTPYAVRLVYLLAKDEPSDYDGPAGVDHTLYGEKLDMALKMMQSATAESMREAGYGRKTFPLEFGKDGRVVVHVVRTDATGDFLRSLDGNALWGRFNDELSKQFDQQVDKVCGVMAFTRWDRVNHKGLAHTALGGGLLGLFGGGTLWSYPASVAEIPKVFEDDRRLDPNVEMDDSGLRGTVWADAATGIGAMLHEMGHTLGLPHSTDRRSFMSRGFDQINRRFVAYEPSYAHDAEGHAVGWDLASHWDPWEAARLNLSPWFQPDGFRNLRYPTALPPKISTEGDDLVVNAPYGLGLLAAVRDGKPTVFREYKRDKSVRLKRSEMGDGPGLLVAVDAYGNQSDLQLP